VDFLGFRSDFGCDPTVRASLGWFIFTNKPTLLIV
jgi:hypothetical protein